MIISFLLFRFASSVFITYKIITIITNNNTNQHEENMSFRIFMSLLCQSVKCNLYITFIKWRSLSCHHFMNVSQRQNNQDYANRLAMQPLHPNYGALSLSVGWMVCRSGDRSVIIFLKGMEVTLSFNALIIGTFVLKEV